MNSNLDFICPTCNVPPASDAVTNTIAPETPTENVLFTTHCPTCKMVAMALDKRGIHYTTVDDPQELTSRGFTSAPMFFLASESRLMNARETLVWANQQGGEA